MFSGIIESIGIIHFIARSSNGMLLNIAAQNKFDDLNIGDSVSVNGVCLTITNVYDHAFEVEVVPETMRVTNLNWLSVWDKVNLERSMKVSARVGGHYVQGHVDGVQELLELKSDGNEALIAKFSLSPKLRKYIVNKGYVALDGMSLTVIDVTANWFTVTFIPHTQKVTIVNRYREGSKVNIEVDILAKYLEKLSGVNAHDSLCAAS